ncbi:Pentatricopeptide repeat-containing protein [Zea mays]|uniref:Pentatricopeptide repeat-containing protein n=1 Tax=Zea mays TaxID=4577 RepID=A0A1D6L094_MAIZE|nr:Pentatricopeptide repeat-containing protein [Zea mays]
MDDDDVSPDARDVYVANATVSSYFAASDVASTDRLFAEVSTDVADVVTWTTMVVGHASSGGLGRARHFFDAMPERNVVSWNAMLRAYACAGMLTEARDLFDAMPTRNAATWSCMISDLVLSGRCWEALHDQGLFGDMVRSSGIVLNEPALELHGAMSVVLASAIVNMYGKCGGIHSAIRALYFVKSMLVEPHPGLWGALASACKMHGKVELGEEVAKKLIELEPRHGSRYILLSNLYGSVNRWDDMTSVRKILKRSKVPKGTGNAVVGMTSASCVSNG